MVGIEGRDMGRRLMQAARWEMGERTKQKSRRWAMTALPLALLLSLLGLLGVCLAPLPADAGEWMEVSCVNPNQSAAPNEGWSAFTSGSPGDGSTGSARCSMFGLLSSAVAEGVGKIGRGSCREIVEVL